MVDPYHITNFERSQEELEEFLLFCTFAANKPSLRAAFNTERFLELKLEKETPLSYTYDLLRSGYLLPMLEHRKIGPYEQNFRRLAELAMGVAGPTVYDMTVESLEGVYGIGPKTARFFILHSRPEQEYAVLDTHILKYLRAIGYTQVPRQTPQNPAFYRALENAFIRDAKEVGRSVAEHDLEVWRLYAEGVVQAA
jgi:thermostable 8-oxoguanine DNA glycosylase